MADSRIAPRLRPDRADRNAHVSRALLFGLALLGAGFAIAGCGIGARDSATTLEADCSDRTWRVGAASSLGEMALAAQRSLAASNPSLRIETTLGPSNLLARQLDLGAPIDVLVSADDAIIERGVDTGALRGGSVREVAQGRLVIVASPDSPLAGAGDDAFRDSRIDRVAVPPATVPLGRYARAWLAERGLLEALEGRIVVTESARATVSAVAQGHVSLALVYESDRRLHPALSVVHQPEADANAPIRYVLAHATQAPNCPALEQITETWTGPAMRARLEAAGFEPPHAAEEAPGRRTGART